MVSQRLINYIKDDLKKHDKEEIKKILVGHGYPEELADKAIKAAVEANEQEKETKIKEEEKEKKSIKQLEEERESKKEHLKVKSEQTKKKLEGLKKKTVEKARKNSKILIPILIIIALGASFFVFNDFFNNKLFGTNKENLHIGLVTNFNGLNDESFNDMAYKALLDSKEKYKTEFEVLEPKNEEEIEKSLRKFAEQKFDLIISIGLNSEKAVNNIATEFPDIKFVIVDGVIDNKSNVASITFKDKEGSYLAGIIAGMMTKSNKVGFIGGANINSIKKFEGGFKEGVKSVNLNASVTSEYLSSDLSGFNKPELGREIAIELYKNDVDIIFHAAGTSGDGIIKAAEEKGKFVIGVDFDQDYMAKGNVLTSVVKRVDAALSIIINKTINNNFKGKIYEFGISNNCISLTEFKYTEYIIPKEVIERIEQANQDIKKKKIKVLLD